jgi:hypothetical protein
VTANLVAFIRARLAEDEQAAQAAEPGPWEVEYNHTSDVGPGWFAVAIATVGADGDRTNPEQVDPVHIARWDPARVLRDVEDKRRIVDLHGRGEEPSDHLCRECANPYPCETVRLLALSDAGHPDYREEWKP